jgi:hypothetical protein
MRLDEDQVAVLYKPNRQFRPLGTKQRPHALPVGIGAIEQAAFHELEVLTPIKSPILTPDDGRRRAGFPWR